MRATAIPALVAALNPDSLFDCVLPVPGSNDEPKPSFIVLLSRTVILQGHDRLPRNEGPFLHSHESINVQRNTKWVADSDLMFPGRVKLGTRVRNELGPLRAAVDSEAPCFGLAVDRDLVSVWKG